VSAGTPPQPPNVIAKAKAWQDRKYATLHAPLPPYDELPELTEKQLERIAAFQFRNED
jgi:hypothetical protein